MTKRDVAGLARFGGEGNADKLRLHLVQRGGFGVHRDLAPHIGGGDPCLQRLRVAHDFIGGMVDGARRLGARLRLRPGGRGDLLRFWRLNARRLGDATGEGVEFHVAQESDEGFGIHLVQLQPVIIGQVRHVIVQDDELLRNADQLCILNEALAALRLLDLLSPRQQRFQIAVFVDQQRRRLDPDPRRARHIVHAVPGEGLYIHHPLRPDAEFFMDLSKADFLAFHQIGHSDPARPFLIDQLHQVLVGGNYGHLRPGRLRLPSIGRDDVVRLIALNLDAGQTEGARGVADQAELRAQILRRFWAVRLVFGIDVIAEGDGGSVEDDRHMGRLIIALQIPQHFPDHVAKAGNRAHRHTVRFAGQGGQGMIGAKNEARSVDEIEVIIGRGGHRLFPSLSGATVADRKGRRQPYRRTPLSDFVTGRRRNGSQATRPALMTARTLFEHEALVAIGALDKPILTNRQPDARMAQRTLAAIAGDACRFHFFDFRGFDSHLARLLFGWRDIIHPARRGKTGSGGARLLFLQKARVHFLKIDVLARPAWPRLHRIFEELEVLPVDVMHDKG